MGRRDRVIKVTIAGDAKSLGRAFSSARGSTAGFQMGIKKLLGMAGIAGLVIGLKRAATAALSMAGDFEQSLAKIEGLVGINKDIVMGWGDEIKKLAPQVGKSAGELAEAMFFITSAGLRGEDAMEALEASAKAASAGLGETKDVAFAAVSAMNAYGAENLTASQAVDILANTVRQGNVEASQVAAVLGNVIPVAAELGVSFDQVGAALAAMTRLGLDSAVATTSLRQIMATMLKPTVQSEAALSKIGLTFADLRKQLREEGLIDVLMDLREGIEGTDVSIADIFPNIRALSGVLNLVGSNAETTQIIFDELANSTGVADEAFEAMAATSKFQLQQAFIELQNVGLEIGSQVLPLLTAAFQLLLPGLKALLTALGPVFEAFGKMAESIGPLLGEVMEELAPVIEDVGVILVEVLGIGLEVVLKAVKAVIPLLEALVPVLRVVADAIGIVGNALSFFFSDMDTSVGFLEDLDDQIVSGTVPSLEDLAFAIALADAESGTGAENLEKYRAELGLNEAATRDLEAAIISQALALDDNALNQEGLARDLAIASIERWKAVESVRALTAAELRAKAAAEERGIADEEAFWAAQNLTEQTEELTWAAIGVHTPLMDAALASTSLAEEMGEAIRNAQGLANQLLRQANPVLDAIKSWEDYEQVLADIADGTLEGDAATLGLWQSMLKLQGSLETLEEDPAHLDAFRISMMQVFGMSRAEVDKLLERLNVLDGMHVNTVIEFTLKGPSQIEIAGRTYDVWRKFTAEAGTTTYALQHGGIARGRFGREGIAATLGEAGTDEAVIPLDDRGVGIIGDALEHAGIGLGAGGGMGGGMTYIENVNLTGIVDLRDPSGAARQFVRELRQALIDLERE